MFEVDTLALARIAQSLDDCGSSVGNLDSKLRHVASNSLMSGSTLATVAIAMNSVTQRYDVEIVRMRSLASAVRNISALYVSAEHDIVIQGKSKLGTDTGSIDSHAQGNGTGGSNNLAQQSALFDDEGSYGGDQGDMEHRQSGLQFLWWRLFKNEELFNIVRTYDGYEKYSDEEIASLFRRLNSEGCGYVATANSILMQYESDPAGFERTFGFPMYDKNGEFNFDRLILDFYLNTDDQYYLDDDQGTNALVVDVLNSYQDRPQDFKNKYGVDPFTSDGNLNVEAMQAVADEYQDQHVVTRSESGVTYYSLSNRIQHYLQQKGVDSTCDIYSDFTVVEVQKELNEGKCVNIGSSKFNLYDYNGRAVKRVDGGHMMTVTGITKEGYLAVSSWGEKYYVHPDELNDKGLLIMDI